MDEVDMISQSGSLDVLLWGKNGRFRGQEIDLARNRKINFDTFLQGGLY